MNFLKKGQQKISLKESKPWTDFNKSPGEVFSDACELIARSLASYGFNYSRSKKELYKKSLNGEFTFRLTFGSSHYNKRGQYVNLTIYFQVFSTRLFRFREEQFSNHTDVNPGKPDDLVTTVNVGYLTAHGSYDAGTWNLITVDPEEIVGLIVKYALPGFSKFEDIDNLIEILKSSGRCKEFINEYSTLDFVMFYGGPEAATQTLLKMIDHRNWTNDFRKLISDYEEGKGISDQGYFLTALLNRSIIYELKV